MDKYLPDDPIVKAVKDFKRAAKRYERSIPVRSTRRQVLVIERWHPVTVNQPHGGAITTSEPGSSESTDTEDYGILCPEPVPACDG